MGRSRGRKARERNKGSLPQVPKNMKYEKISEEYAAELENQLDREERALSNAANQRVQENRSK